MATGVGLTHFACILVAPKTLYLVISHIQVELTPISCLNLAIFVTMATRVDLAKNMNDSFDWLTPKNPVWCKNLGPILNLNRF